MIIKINSIPWDEVKTPEPLFDPIGAIVSYEKGLYYTLVSNDSLSNHCSEVFFRKIDQSVYWVMDKTEVTGHVYKAACWGVDTAFTFLGVSW